MTWKTFSSQSPELADFAQMRLHNKVTYLATIRKDGSPRVHPFTPIIGEGHLFVFMEPTSPKGHDLRRDPRYALHCSVSDTSGESGEVILTGRARFLDDADMRAVAVRVSPYQPAERYILFELEIESVTVTEYPEGGAVRRYWKINE